jgi:hypothetical protein
MRGKDFGRLGGNGVVSKHLTFELVGLATRPLESFRDLVKSPRLPSTAPVPQRAQDSGRL